MLPPSLSWAGHGDTRVTREERPRNRSWEKRLEKDMCSRAQNAKSHVETLHLDACSSKLGELSGRTDGFPASQHSL